MWGGGKRGRVDGNESTYYSFVSLLGASLSCRLMGVSSSELTKEGVWRDILVQNVDDIVVVWAYEG